MARNTSGLRRGGPGRPKGVPNKATIAAKEWAGDLVSDTTYRANFRRRFLSGRLAPALEAMVHHYAYGKPIETIREEGPDGGPKITRVIHEHHDA